MKEILKKFFRFLPRFIREIVDVVGLGNILVILFVVWFIHSPLWVRLRVLLGFASEEETEAVKAENKEINDETADRWSKGETVSDNFMFDNPLVVSTQKQLAFMYYLRGCKEKGLIPSWKYYGLTVLPSWAISDKMIEKYKNLYLYGIDSDSK